MEALQQRIDVLAKEYDVSGIVTVLHDKTVLHDAVYGYADREANRPLLRSDSFCFSVESSLILGLSFMQLMQQGKIRAADKLSRFLPAYRFADAVTIRQLFCGTSGIPESVNAVILPTLHTDELPEAERLLTEAIACEQQYPFAAIFEMVKAQPLRHAPGKVHDFSDTESSFLYEALSRAAQMDAYAFVQTQLFAPLGMKNTHAGADATTNSSIRGRLSGLQPMPTPTNGGYFTTTHDDLLLLLHALQDGSLFSERVWRAVTAFDSEGYGIGFEGVDGFLCAGLYRYGTEAMLMLDRKQDGTSYLVTMCEQQKQLRENGSWQAFRPKLRREIAPLYCTPVAPKLVPYGTRNVFAGLQLEVAPSQVDFVSDAKTCLAWAYANKRTQRSYLLMDEGRAVGLIVLKIDKKNDAFDISDVLIDRRYQRRGYGKIMLKQAMQILQQHGAKTLTLYCSRNNEAAQRLYQSVGFSITSRYQHICEMQCTLADAVSLDSFRNKEYNVK